MVKRLKIENDVKQMANLEAFLDEVCDEFGVAPDAGFQIHLGLDEAVANSVNYAYGEGNEGAVILEAEKDADFVVFRLIDEGSPFDPTEVNNVVDTTTSAEERPIGGLGIFLIKQMMDDVAYERKDNKNVLTLKKKL